MRRIKILSLVLLAFVVNSAYAYTDTEFAFKIAAERKLKSILYGYLSQTIPTEDFKVTISANVFTQEPISPYEDVNSNSDDLPNAFTVNDPMDLSLGVIQGQKMTEALKGRDKLIDVLKKDLEKAKAPTYAGVEILELSVWLGLSDKYSPQDTKKIQDRVSTFVTESFRITPKVYVESLLQETSPVAKDELGLRSPASENSPPPKEDDFMKWLAGGLLLSLILSLLAMVLRSRMNKKQKLADEEAPKPLESTQFLNITTKNEVDPPKLEKEHNNVTSFEFGKESTTEIFAANLSQLSEHLQHSQKDHVEKLVQHWSEGGAEGHRKAAILLRTWSELMPDEQIHCPMGQEVFETFRSWKDIAIEDKIKTTEEALWELAAVNSMGTEILGSSLERIRNISASRVASFLSGGASAEECYVLWGLLDDRKKQKILRQVSARIKFNLFNNVWDDSLNLDADTIQQSIKSIATYLDKSPSPTGSADLEESLAPLQAKKSFILSLDAKSEVELLWPKLSQEGELLSEIRKEALILSTLTFLKEEFWRYPDLLPEENEFISLAKIMGSQASEKILGAMPSLASTIYSSRLQELGDSVEPMPEDFRNADSYLSRIRQQLKSQNMSPADITRDRGLWPLNSLGRRDSGPGDNYGAESA